MKINFETKNSFQISLINEIPDFKKMKLLGYNGIGKSLTANILATISGEPVWTDEKNIKNLANFIPSFTLNIDLNDKKYRIESDVGSWSIEDISGKLNPKSIGNIFLNGKKTSIENFWNDFKCYKIKGNEDIDSQIETLRIKIKRAILFNINNIRDKFIIFQEELNNLQNLLSKDRLYLKILNDEELISNSNFKEYDSTIINSIERLINGLKIINDKSWFSYEGPNESYKNLLTLKENLNIKLNNLKLKLEEIHKNLSNNNLTKMDNIIQDIKINNEKKEAIIFPLDRKQFWNEDETNKGKIQIINKIKEKRKSEKLFDEDNFRKEFWTESISNLNYYSNRDKIDLNVDLLFKVRNRESLSIKDLKLWYQETTSLSKKMLKQLGNYEKIKNEIDSLEEKVKKFDEHVLVINQWNFLEKRNQQNKEKLSQSLGAEQKVKDLPELEIKLKDLESELSTLNFIELHLKNLIIYKNWKIIFPIKQEIKNFDDFIKIFDDLLDNLKEFTQAKKRFEKNKDLFMENSDKLKEELPQSIKKLVEKKEIIKICKIAEFLNSHNLQIPILDFLEKDCESIINNSNENEKVKSEQSLFISKMNSFLGDKIKKLLNMEAFREHVFGNCEIITVNPQQNILEYKDEDGNISKKFIADYSTGQKAFAFSMASILNAKSLSSVNNTLLILDEFGAMLAEDKERFLIDTLDLLQSKENWPSSYIIVLPYKGEFERTEYVEKMGKNLNILKKELKERGYAFEQL